MSPEEIFIVSCVTEFLIYILESYTFCLYFILFLLVWIHKAPEYGSNTDPVPDPDPQHWTLTKGILKVRVAAKIFVFVIS